MLRGGMRQLTYDRAKAACLGGLVFGAGGGGLERGLEAARSVFQVGTPMLVEVARARTRPRAGRDGRGGRCRGGRVRSAVAVPTHRRYPPVSPIHPGIWDGCGDVSSALWRRAFPSPDALPRRRIVMAARPNLSPAVSTPARAPEALHAIIADSVHPRRYRRLPVRVRERRHGRPPSRRAGGARPRRNPGLAHAFFALRPRMTIVVQKKVEGDGLALSYGRWELVGTGPDGNPTELSGFGAMVFATSARRNLEDRARRPPAAGLMRVVQV